MGKTEVSLHSFIVDFTFDGNPLDYYGFTDATRAISCAEEDPFSESDVEKFLDNNVEARNYWVKDEMSEEGDVSADTTKTLKNSFTILTSVKMATLGLLKIKVFQKKVMVS